MGLFITTSWWKTHWKFTHFPFLSREKQDSDNRRIIVDPSFPPAFAVNSNIKKDVYLDSPFLLTLPTVDHIVQQIVKHGRGSHISKVDISRAFRNLKIDPKDFWLLCPSTSWIWAFRSASALGRHSFNDPVITSDTLWTNFTPMMSLITSTTYTLFPPHLKVKNCLKL